MDIIATDAVLEKLAEDHEVTLLEVEEAWFNLTGPMFEDDRIKNKTNPPTCWFISETFSGRILKVVGIPYYSKGKLVLRTAYDPDLWEIELYENNIRRR